MRIKLLVVLFISFSICVTAKEKQEPLPTSGLLWKITGNGLKNPSYLFGTYHAQGGMQILDSIKNINSMFNSVEQFLCETKYDYSIYNESKVVYSASNYQLKPWPIVDSTYSNLLTIKQKIVFDSVFNSNKTLEFFKSLDLRPFQLMCYLKQSYNDAHNKLINNRIKETKHINSTTKKEMLDVYLQRLATQHKINIVGLDSDSEFKIIKESADTQRTIVSYRSEADQLMYYIENHSIIDSLEQKKLANSLSAYLKQDIGKLASYQDKKEDFNNIPIKFDDNRNLKLLVDERNNMWMTKIPTLFKDKSSFVAVGAAHLPGEKGLVNQLRKLGYVVENISCVEK